MDGSNKEYFFRAQSRVFFGYMSSAERPALTGGDGAPVGLAVALHRNP
jgi:hypothetical protein